VSPVTSLVDDDFFANKNKNRLAPSLLSRSLESFWLRLIYYEKKILFIY